MYRTESFIVISADVYLWKAHKTRPSSHESMNLNGRHAFPKDNEQFQIDYILLTHV